MAALQCYTWQGLMAVCMHREGGGLKRRSGGGGYNSRVDMSVSQRPAGDWPLLPRRPLTPVETVPRQVAARSLWKHLSHCLSDWPYGRQCHPGTPRCARHGVWEAWVGRMEAPTPHHHRHIPEILSLVSPQYVLTQLHAVIYGTLRRDIAVHITHIQTRSHVQHMRTCEHGSLHASSTRFLIIRLYNQCFCFHNSKIKAVKWIGSMLLYS